MLITDPYPYLAHLLHAYFHQDAFDDGEGEEEIVQEFKRVSHDYEVLGTHADILRFLHQHDDDASFLRSFEQTFSPDLSIGNDNEQARAWLRNVSRMLSS